MGTLVAIARREKSRAPMQQLQSVCIAPDTGLEGDSRGIVRGRNVSVLSLEAWRAACADLGMELPWTTRRANLLVSGLDLQKTAGKQLEIGNVILEIREECDPCNRMEESRAGLRAALMPFWRGGILCTVARGGEVNLGDPVRLTENSGA